MMLLQKKEQTREGKGNDGRQFHRQMVFGNEGLLAGKAVVLYKYLRQAENEKYRYFGDLPDGPALRGCHRIDGTGISDFLSYSDRG